MRSAGWGAKEQEVGTTHEQAGGGGGTTGSRQAKGPAVQPLVGCLAGALAQFCSHSTTAGTAATDNVTYAQLHEE